MAIHVKDQMTDDAQNILRNDGLYTLPPLIQDELVQRMVNEVLQKRVTAKAQSIIGGLARGALNFLGGRSMVTQKYIGESLEDLQIKEQQIRAQCADLVKWFAGFSEGEKLSDVEKTMFMRRKMTETVPENFKSAVEKAVRRAINTRIRQERELNELPGIEKLSKSQIEHFNQLLQKEDDVAARINIITDAAAEIEKVIKLEIEQSLQRKIEEQGPNFKKLPIGLQDRLRENLQKAYLKIRLASKEGIDFTEIPPSLHAEIKEKFKNKDPETLLLAEKHAAEREVALKNIEREIQIAIEFNGSGKFKAIEPALNSQNDLERSKSTTEALLMIHYRLKAEIELNKNPEFHTMTKSKQEELIAEMVEELEIEDKIKFPSYRDNIRNKYSIDIHQQFENDKLLKNISKELSDYFKSSLSELNADKELLNQKVWQLVSDERWKGDNANELEKLRARYQSGDKKASKEIVEKLNNHINSQTKEINNEIQIALWLENTNGFTKFKTSSEREKIAIIQKLATNFSQLKEINTQAQKCQAFLKNPDVVVDIEHPPEIIYASKAERIKYYQDKLSTLNAKYETISREMQTFQNTYYEDAFIKDMDEIFSRKEAEKGILTKGLELMQGAYKSVRYNPYNPIYNSKTSWAIAGGAAAGTLGVVIVGPIAGLVGAMTAGSALAAGGAVACYVQPRLTVPLVIAAGLSAGVFVAAGAGLGAGVGAVAAIGAAPVGMGIGYAGQQYVEKHPMAAKFFQRIGADLWAGASSLGKFVSYPFREFYKALDQYNRGNNKLYNGIRMAGIVLGATLGVAAFVALNIFTAGAPAIVVGLVSGLGSIGGYLFAAAGANLGAYTCKSLSSLKSETRFNEPDKYLLEKDAIRVLGKGADNQDNGIKIGKHFEKNIEEMRKVIKKMQKAPVSPERDREIAEVQDYIASLEKAMLGIKQAGSDPKKLKIALDNYIKTDYELKRSVYLSLISSSVQPQGELAQAKPLNHEAMNKIKNNMHELKNLNEISKYLESVLDANKNALVAGVTQTPVLVGRNREEAAAKAAAKKQTSNKKYHVPTFAQVKDTLVEKPVPTPEKDAPKTPIAEFGADVAPHSSENKPNKSK